MTAEKEDAIYFSEQKKKLYLSLNYIGANSYLFVNSVEIHKFKEKDSEIKAAPLCLGNVLKYFSSDNIKKTGLYIDVSMIFNGSFDSHKYLMKKRDIK